MFEENQLFSYSFLFQPHNLDLIDIDKEELQFTFTNTESTVLISTFVFDFEVSYFVDQGDTAIPGGTCSTDGGNNYSQGYW